MHPHIIIGIFPNIFINITDLVLGLLYLSLLDLFLVFDAVYPGRHDGWSKNNGSEVYFVNNTHHTTFTNETILDYFSAGNMCFISQGHVNNVYFLLSGKLN